MQRSTRDELSLDRIEPSRRAASVLRVEVVTGNVRLHAAIAFYAMCGLTLWRTRGHANDLWLIAFVATWLIMVAATLRATPLRALPAVDLRTPCVAWLALTGLVWSYGGVLREATEVFWLRSFRAASLLMTAASLAVGYLMLKSEGEEATRAKKRRVAIALSVLTTVVIVAQAMVLRASPAPGIDVFTCATAAADHLLAGRNPYEQVYGDIYGGRYDYPPVMVYWPAVLLWETVARWIFHDVRVGTLLAELIAGLFCYKTLVTLRVPRTHAWLFALGWVAFPVAPFVLEQAWMDPLLVMSFAALACALALRRPLAAGAALGLVLSFKQYGSVGAAITLVYLVRAFGPRRAAHSAAIALGTFAATILPFLAWNARALLYMTVFVPAHAGMRSDSLGLLPLLSDTVTEPWPSRITAVATIAVTAASTAWLARRPVRLAEWATALVFAYMSLFLLSKQAFCNYYYFTSFFAWAAAVFLAAHPLPPWRDSVGGASKPNNASSPFVGRCTRHNDILRGGE